MSRLCGASPARSNLLSSGDLGAALRGILLDVRETDDEEELKELHAALDPGWDKAVL